MDEDAEDRYFNSDLFQGVLDVMAEIEEHTGAWIIAVGLPPIEWHFFPADPGIDMFEEFANQAIWGDAIISVP